MNLWHLLRDTISREIDNIKEDDILKNFPFFMKKREARKKLIHFPKEKSSGDASQANFDLSKESFLFIYSFVALKNALSKKTTRDGRFSKKRGPCFSSFIQGQRKGDKEMPKD